MLSKTQDPKLVGVFRHTYSNGEGITIYASLELAWKAAEQMAKSYRNDFNVPEEVTDLEAAKNWAKLTHEEEFVDVWEEPIHYEVED